MPVSKEHSFLGMEIMESWMSDARSGKRKESFEEIFYLLLFNIFPSIYGLPGALLSVLTK